MSGSNEWPTHKRLRRRDDGILSEVREGWRKGGSAQLTNCIRRNIYSLMKHSWYTKIMLISMNYCIQVLLQKCEHRHDTELDHDVSN